MSVFKENNVLPAICPMSNHSHLITGLLFFNFLFILPLTFNHHFILFLDGEPAELINIPVTHTQATTRTRETLKESEGEKQKKKIRAAPSAFLSISRTFQSVKAVDQSSALCFLTVHLHLFLIFFPSLSSLETQVFIHYSWWPVCVFVSRLQVGVASVCFCRRGCERATRVSVWTTRRKS